MKPLRVVTDCLLGLVLFVIVLALFQASNHASTPAAVTVNIGSDEVAPVGTATVPLQVSGVVNLGAVTLEIRYDPSILDANACNADPGGVFDVALCNHDYDDNSVGTDAVRFTAASVGGVSGNIVLAEITFQAVGQPGDTSVLDVVKDGEVFADTGGDPIDFTDADGLITITGLGTITIVKEMEGQTPGSDWQFSGDLDSFTLPAGGGQQTFSDLDPGDYTIIETAEEDYSASVSCTSGEGDGNSVTVSLDAGEDVTCIFTNTFSSTQPWDVNDDGVVDINDIREVASRWRCRSGDNCYHERYDLDRDGDIDVVDIMLVAAHWGETCD